MFSRNRRSSVTTHALDQLARLAGGSSRTARQAASALASITAGKPVSAALGYVGQQVAGIVNQITGGSGGSGNKPTAPTSRTSPPPLRAGQTRRQQQEMMDEMRRFFEMTGAMGPPPAPPGGSGDGRGSGNGGYNSPPPPPSGGGSNNGGYGRYGDTPSPGAGGSGGRFPTGITGYPEPPMPGERSPFGEEVLTPQSSNVFSFSYVRHAGQPLGTLYVTYNAPILDAKKITRGRVRHGGGTSREQLIGSAGAYVGGSGKGGSRGPMYAYLKVPPAIYTQMRNAHSKGSFVWDNLRVRGTIHGHRYQYVLVQGAVVPGGGVGGVYIPRRATAAGFKTRSVRDIGAKGRSGTFQTSTLSPRTFQSRTAPRK